MIIFVCCNNYKTFNEFFGLEKQMKIYSISPPGDKLTGFLHTVNKTVFITPPSAARGGLKENSQNPDSGSKNSENQNNDAVS